MIFIRKALDYVFSKDELRVLDSIIPPIRMKSQNKYISPSLDSAESTKPESSNGIPCITNQNKPLTKRNSSVNISNEVVKSGVWIHVNQRNAPFRTIEWVVGLYSVSPAFTVYYFPCNSHSLQREGKWTKELSDKRLHHRWWRITATYNQHWWGSQKPLRYQLSIQYIYNRHSIPVWQQCTV